jgi:hypothetical protein
MIKRAIGCPDDIGDGLRYSVLPMFSRRTPYLRDIYRYAHLHAVNILPT